MKHRTQKSKRLGAKQRAREALQNEFLVGSEIAAVARVSPALAYGALARGLIPGASRVGRSYRATLAQVRAWVAAGCPGGGSDE